MLRIGLAMVCLALFACSNSKKGPKGEEGFSYNTFSSLFRKGFLPYTLTDTGFLKNKDTATLSNLGEFIPDSVETPLFGKGAHIRYIAMDEFAIGKNTRFFIVKASGNGRKAALLVVFNKDQYAATLPFLVPDADASTSQVSGIDKTQSILKTITQKRSGGPLAEGRDAYEYEAEGRQFLLILTNPLNGGAVEVINPIDTFPRKHKFAGDYAKDKHNFVSVRDGRFPNQLQVFVHIGQADGACSGEIKGDLLMTSSTTAIYRQGGDPCIVSFRFTPGAVTVKEDEGCGSRRGLDCSFNGNFARKKEIKPKSGRGKK